MHSPLGIERLQHQQHQGALKNVIPLARHCYSYLSLASSVKRFVWAGAGASRRRDGEVRLFTTPAHLSHRKANLSTRRYVPWPLPEFHPKGTMDLRFAVRTLRRTPAFTAL